MAGRTRFRLNLTEKKEERHIIDSDSDSVIFIEERGIDSDSDGVGFIEERDIDSDHYEDDGDGDDDVVSFTGESDEEDVTRLKKRRKQCSSGVAGRTRSQTISKLGKRKSKQGTFTNPIDVDDEEKDEEDEKSNKSLSEQADSSDDAGGCKNRISRKRKGSETISDSCGGRISESDGENISVDTDKSVDILDSDPRYFDAVKILLDSLCDQDGKNKKVLGSKSEELDHLWSEMNHCLYASDHESDQDEVARCQHQNSIRDEEIGLICKDCSYVLDIKYCDVPFAKISRRSSSRRYSFSSDDDDVDANHLVHNSYLQDQISSCNEDSSDYYDTHFGPTGTVWDIVSSKVKKGMYSHQKEAFEFLLTNLAGGVSLKELQKPLDFVHGSGCIISHAPGTGKTCLAIVFLQAFLKLYPTCKPIIVAPSSMLLTWEEEFKKWKIGIPFHNLNNPENSGEETSKALGCVQRGKNNKNHRDLIRYAKLSSWKNERSILGISYKLFENLAGESFKNEKDVNKYMIIIRKVLQETPGLVVLDEGHTPRNSKSLRWKALSRIKTKRRIILSGTPFQNNFSELYDTLRLVKPEFDEKSGNNKTGLELKYLCNSISKVKSVGEKNKILEKIRVLIKPFVHMHKHNVLQESLPGLLKETVLILKPTQLQEFFQDINHKIRTSTHQHGTLKLEHLESLTAVHPSLHPETESNKLEIGGRLNPEDGVKTKFLMKLIEHSESLKEKVLVFSQYIEPLDFLCELFKSHFKWTEGKEILQMQGKHDVTTRQASIKAFNDPKSKVRVMLASTRACKEGISLVGASRVVLLDVVWNPSVERQAVSRAYRIGQKKDVYTYHLITSGTMDKQKCCSQAEKDHFAESVFFCNYSDNGFGPTHSSESLKDEILERMIRSEDIKHIFEKITTNKRTLL